MKFDSLSLVPFDNKLIDNCALTRAQVEWLNAYNAETREKIMPLLEFYPDVKKFLMEQTKPFSLYYRKDSDGVCRDYRDNAGIRSQSSKSAIILSSVIATCLGKFFF